MAKFTECLGFNLSYSFSGYVELVPDFLKCSCSAVVKTEAQYKPTTDPATFDITPTPVTGNVEPHVYGVEGDAPLFSSLGVYTFTYVKNRSNSFCFILIILPVLYGSAFLCLILVIINESAF